MAYDKQIQENLQDIVRHLVDAYHPLQIVLYGSFAWGAPHADSDIDLLIVKDTEETPLQRRVHVRRLVAQARRHFRRLCSPQPSWSSAWRSTTPSMKTSWNTEFCSIPDIESSLPEDWLALAIMDVEAAAILLEENGPLAIVAFHLQQATSRTYADSSVSPSRKLSASGKVA